MHHSKSVWMPMKVRWGMYLSFVVLWFVIVVRFGVVVAVVG